MTAVANIAGQFGDTTYTKVFVGGLAWETQKDTMKKYFEQFGEILEAVVITDKTSGRSKGYGFVTFREPDAAMRACVDAAPVIDGRRANCNLASLGVQRSKPSTPKHDTCLASFCDWRIRFSPYSAEYAYPTSYYGVYGGASAQYPLYGSGSSGLVSGAAAAAAAAYYPYLNFSEGSGGATGYTGNQGRDRESARTNTSSLRDADHVRSFTSSYLWPNHGYLSTFLSPSIMDEPPIGVSYIDPEMEHTSLTRKGERVQNHMHVHRSISALASLGKEGRVGLFPLETRVHTATATATPPPPPPPPAELSLSDFVKKDVEAVKATPTLLKVNPALL
ncbi:hypothetical protein SASPL_100083 [Salvia splendens]|uniref:RRM domain-containing protein n=1 Tax=Salvia splendens TaxID=180675 RepID=A0A8X8YT87_SALSN|nr:hypothetical protein SASPL_100083 [Salvia splendens]